MFSLTAQELSQYTVPLLIGLILLSLVLQQFMRAQRLQQQSIDQQAALRDAQQQLHEQDTELQVLGSQQDQLYAQLQLRESDYQQLKNEYSAVQQQLLQTRSIADTAQASYRELKEQQQGREPALAQQQAV